MKTRKFSYKSQARKKSMNKRRKNLSKFRRIRKMRNLG